MEISQAVQVAATEHDEANLKKADSVADSIIALATGLGGLNELGVWAGGVKAESLINAIIYSIPALVMAIALLLAFITKFIQSWGTTEQAYAAALKSKRAVCRIAIGFVVAGAILFFIAIFVYLTRSLNLFSGS